jgi:hypothetical protein
MSELTGRIWTICGCIDHCFAFAMWCDDFAQYVDPDDLMAGLDRAFELVSDATRLQSFLALRKLDEFLSGKKRKDDDLVIADFGIDKATVLGNLGNDFLSAEERESINKGVAHLIEKLSLDPDGEVELENILKRSTPVMSRLVSELRKIDANQEAKHWLDQTEALIKRAEKLSADRVAKLAALSEAAAPPI